MGFELPPLREPGVLLMVLGYQADLLGYSLVSELVTFNSLSSILIFAPWRSKPTERVVSRRGEVGRWTEYSVGDLQSSR